jgi:RNA polymerase sigma-70 factor (ECF subfamily)
MNIIKNLCQQRDIRQKIASNHSRLYRTAYAWGHDADLASDLAQETMAKALKRVNQLRDPNKLNSWLFGILINCWRDYFRQQRDHIDIDEVELKHEDTPEKLNQTQDMVDSVRDSIARLPEGQRQVVTLVNLEGFSYGEVAEILDIPVGTVMSRLSRARNTLAKSLLTFKTNQDVKLANTKPEQVRLRRIK